MELVDLIFVQNNQISGGFAGYPDLLSEIRIFSKSQYLA